MARGDTLGSCAGTRCAGRPSRVGLFAIFLSAAFAVSAAPAELWVSPDGNDRAAGTREQPFATIQMAQRKARELRRQDAPTIADGIHIVVRGGTYQLAAPWLIRWEDSGTAASPTVFRAAPGERVIVSGGTAVSGWRKPTSEVAGLPGKARPHVLVAEAPRVAGDRLRIRDLWVGERKAVRARTLRDGEMHQLAGWDRPNEVATIPATVLGGIAEPAGLEMIIAQQWEIAILRVRSIERSGDLARLTFHSPESAIEFQHPWPQPILPPEGGGAFFLANAIEFLDEPGEWFQDRESGLIYYWPLAGEDVASVGATVPVLSTLLEVKGTLDRPVRHVFFRDIAFAHSAWNEPGRSGHVPLQAGMPLVEAYKIDPPGTPDKKGLENQAWITRMPAAILVDAAHDLIFEGCRFQHLAAAGVDLRSGVRDSRVEGCVIRDVGGNGIQIGSFQEGGVETHVPYAPADDREVCARIRIANNVLRDTANTDWGCVAVISGYARELQIEHNDIADTSYTGISVGWGWTRTVNASRENHILRNRIVRFATRLCDTAGVYTLSAQPGTLVSENLVDEVRIASYVDRPDHWFYLYTDEGTAHVTVRDNWIPSPRILQNANGPGNVWLNNGPEVSPLIKERAGLEPPFRRLLGSIQLSDAPPQSRRQP